MAFDGVDGAGYGCQLPAWAQDFATSRERYLVAWGGRAAGRSWTFARLIVLRATQSRLRVLCARETQESIDDSVRRVLVDMIEAMRLPGWTCGRDRLSHSNGSEITFIGIRTDPAKIKSTEGIDICWVEEAESVSENSWNYLTPTIRAPGSQILATFNTRFESDPTYKRFVISPPPNSLIRKVSWRDNPWLSWELDVERRWLMETDPDAYQTVWEGEPIRSSSAQVLRGMVSVRTFSVDPGEGGWDGPYYGIDWGFATDPTAANRCWIRHGSLWIDHEAHGDHVETDALPGLLMGIPGLPEHIARADCSRPETISYVVRHGLPRVQPCRKWPGSVEDGIARLRSYAEIVIHPRCEHTIQETVLYRHKTDRLSGDVLPALVDRHNHHIDAIRYALQPVIFGERRLPEPEPPPESDGLDGLTSPYFGASDGWMV